MHSTIFKILLCTFFIAQQQSGNAFASNKPITAKEENVTFKIIPGTQDAVFRKTKPRYTIKIESTYKEKQSGTFSYILTDAKHQFIAKGTADLNIGKMASVSLPVELPVTEPGFYEFTAMINIDYYEDTVRNVCAYQPERINTPLHKPADFDAFWDKTKQELAKVPPAYVVTRSNEKSDYAHDVYLVEMQSLDTVKVYGWLTVPKLKKNYPVLLALPGYRVELKPQLPDEFAIFALNIRGIHPSTERIDPKNTEYNLYNIQDKNKYIYRGAYMDCIRAVDFISSHAYMGLDVSRIAVGGGSQGAALAIALCGLDNRVSCCVADNPIYCDMHTTYEINTKGRSVSWPFSRFIEYVKYKPNVHIDNIIAVLDYFDPQNFASSVQCPVLVGVGSLDNLAPPVTIFSMYNKLNAKAKSGSEIYVFPDKAHEVNIHHGKFRNIWMLEKLVTKHEYAR